MCYNKGKRKGGHCLEIFRDSLTSGRILTPRSPRWTASCATIEGARSADEALAAYKRFETLQDHLTTMATLTEIRNSIDTRDAFYEAEKAFFDENGPAISDRALNVYRALLASPHRAGIGEALGAVALEKMEIDVKAQTPEVLDLMAEENALVQRLSEACTPRRRSFRRPDADHRPAGQIQDERRARRAQGGLRGRGRVVRRPPRGVRHAVRQAGEKPHRAGPPHGL